MKMAQRIWGVNAIVLTLEGLLVALAAGWIIIPSPVLATLAATSLLLVLPGWLLLSLFDCSLNWARKIGMAFAISVGMWSVPGLILLSIHSNLKVMLGVIVGVTLALGLVFVGRSIRADRARGLWGRSRSARSQWPKSTAILNTVTLFAALGLVLGAYVSTVNVAHTDRRNYEKYLMDYLEADKFFENLHIISPDRSLPARGTNSTWNLLVASSIKLAQGDLFTTYNFYLPLVLMILSCFSLYALAYELFADGNTAWFAVLLQIVYLGSGVFPKEGVGYGLKWLFRIQEDKYALWFLLLPAVLAVTGRFLRSGRKSWFYVLGLCLFGITVVHPFGLIYYGTAFGGYAIFQSALLFLQSSRHRSLRQLVGETVRNPLFLRILAVTILVGLALFLPFLQRQSQVITFAARGVDERFFEVVEDKAAHWLLALGNGRYVVDYRVLNNPFIIAALIATPWLVFRGFKRCEARFLAAGMIMPGLLVFTPVAPFIGRLSTALLLWRLVWIMPVSLVLTFVLVDLVRWLRSRQVLAGRRGLFVLLPLSVWLSAFLLRPQIADAAETLWQFHWQTGSSTPATVSYSEYDLFSYMRTHVEPGSTVFADEPVNFNLPGMVGRAYGVTFSQQPPRFPHTFDDVHFFFNTSLLSTRHLEILELHEARYVVMPTENLLSLQFASVGAAAAEIYQNEGYSLFQLATGWPVSEIINHTVAGNDLFRDGLYAEAARRYEKVLTMDPTNIWASVMLGDIYRQQELYSHAQRMYEQALRYRPDVAIYMRLGDVYHREGQFDLAEAQYRHAQELRPEYMPVWTALYMLAGDRSQAKGNLEQAIRHYRDAITIRQCGNPPAEMVLLRDRYLPPGWPIIFQPSNPVIEAGQWAANCLSSHDSVPELTPMHVDSDLVQDFEVALTSDATGQLLHTTVFTIQDDPRAVLFAHPPSRVSYVVLVEGSSALHFSLAVSPEVWQVGNGDGVRFDVYLDDGNTFWHPFSEYIDPKNVASHRQWNDREIDLSSWVGQAITITLATGPGPNGDSDYDWAGWGEPRVVRPISYDFLTELPNANRGDADEEQVRQDTLTIDYEPRAVLFQRPASRVTYHLELPEGAGLHFGLGMDPAVWSSDKGDGAEYNIYVRKPDEPQVLHRVFHRYLDPKNDPADRHWQDQVVDLGIYGGQTVDIIFEARPGPAGDNGFDWGGWSRPVLVTGLSSTLGTDLE